MGVDEVDVVCSANIGEFLQSPVWTPC